jgi:hypothetical protein
VFRPFTEDDRHRRVATRWFPSNRRGGDALRELARLARTLSGMLVITAAAAVVIITLVAFFGDATILAFSMFSPISAGVLVLIVTALVALQRGLSERGEVVKSQSLSRGECPTCGYALVGDAEHQPRADADGCVVCPECGGAWNLGEHSAGPRPRVLVRSD